MFGCAVGSAELRFVGAVFAAFVLIGLASGVFFYSTLFGIWHQPFASARFGEAGLATLRGPRELCCRECRSALVRNAKTVDLRSCGACNRQLGACGMEDASELRRLPRVDTERHHVLDLEVNRVSDAHRMAEAL